MNSKNIGIKFEQEACDILAEHGFWVHFITPDARGAQPFDIIAVKNKKAYAIECKTLTFSRRYFTYDRLEDNQILAFNRWLKCGNGEPIILVKQGIDISSFRYIDLVSNNNRFDVYSDKNTEYIVSSNGYKIHGILKGVFDGEE